MPQYEGTETLLHEGADGEPEAVGERELVVQGGVVVVAAAGRRRRRRRGLVMMRGAVPLVRTEPRHDEQRQADDDVRGEHRDPDLERQRRQEREQARRLVDRALEEDADAEVHERLREVDHLLAHVADRQRRHRNVRFLQPLPPPRPDTSTIIETPHASSPSRNQSPHRLATSAA